MTNHLLSKTEYEVGDIIPLFESNLNNWYDWTIREKKRHSNQCIYFLTRPGYEGWFTHIQLKKQIMSYFKAT